MLYTLLALLLMQTNVVSAQTPDYLQIKKVKIDGIDAYSTPYFNFSSTDSSLKGKIFYMPLKIGSLEDLSVGFLLQDNHNELMSKLKEFTNESFKDYSLKIIANPKSFLIHLPKRFGCIGKDWDGYDDCSVIYIRFDLSKCMFENQKEYTNRFYDFKKQITKCKFEKIHIEYNGEVVEIPLEIPLNEIIREMERINLNEKSEPNKTTYRKNDFQYSGKWDKKYSEVVVKWNKEFNKALSCHFTYESVNKVNQKIGGMFNKASEGAYLAAASLGVGIYNEVFQYKDVFRDTDMKFLDNYEFKAYIIHSIAYYLNLAGYYQDALYFAIEAEKLIKNLKSRNMNDIYINYLYCESLFNLGSVHAHLNSKESHIWTQKCLELCKGVSDWEDLYYQALNNEAIAYYRKGFIEKTIEIEKVIIESAPNVLDVYKTNYISFLYHNGKKKDAIEALEEMIDDKKAKGDTTSIAYADLIHNLAIYYADVEKSLSLIQESIDIYKENGAAKKENYAYLLDNLASLKSEQKLYQEALDIESHAYKILSFVFKDRQSPRRLNVLRKMSEYQYYTKRWKDAEKNLIDINDADTTLIYSLLTNTRCRTYIWNGLKGVYNSFIPKLTYHIKTDSLNMTAYNAALFSKGLLLNTERTLYEINNNNPQVLQLYNEWQNLKNRLSTSQSFEQYQSLENKIANAESEYYKSVETSEDFHKRLYVRWNDVKSKLGVKDIAIEFFSFKDDDEITKYFALVLKKDFASPALVPLFNETELPSTGNAYKGHELGNLVWKPMEKYLEGGENIYFSPSGQLHIYAIENAKHWIEETYMCDKYNIFRLSSTRELVLDNAATPIKKALVFGGIKYKGVALDTYIAESRNNPVQKEANYFDLALNDSKSRGGDGELPYSKIEVAKIHSILTNNGVSSTLKDSIHATENAFKALAVKDVDVIHLSTHGEYLVDTIAKTLSALEMYNFLSPDVNNNQEDEERATLSRSYLKLAGANEKYSKKLPEDVNDGKLTAYEISMLNLDRVNLAVLAACQSGLGDIRGDEVFGLQRGFKKAGVKSILMSLCQIDDEETTYFMTKFYEYMISENKMSKAQMSKALSFKKAKEATRSKYKDKGSDTWANFILIDAIN